MNRVPRANAAILVVAILAMLPLLLSSSYAGETIERVTVFSDNMIHFNPDSAGIHNPDGVRSEDNGRVVARSVTLPEIDSVTVITGHLTVRPIPKDEISVHDKWDRAGNVRVAIDGQPDAELLKFITAYGGRTEYRVDLTHLAPMLQGEVTLKAFIDTWVSPAWRIDFDLEYVAEPPERATDWAIPLLYEESFDRQTYGDTGTVVQVTVPQGQQRVLLHYYVSGHCTDGRGADEFVKKDNVIAIDGAVVYRYQPWRDDCRRFRDINPYTRRWSDGYWSSDYSRSGWCPGDWVQPLVLDLSDHLTPGDHTVSFRIENIRPRDENDHYGYWRVSAQLLGVSE